ncbi:MAG: carbohydrate-binding domain-containing protein [Aristaeellaceae bacterium]
MKWRMISLWIALMLLITAAVPALAEDTAIPAALTAEDQFTNGDMTSVNPEEATPIVLGDRLSDEGTGYLLEGGVLIITSGGSYLLSGEVQDGQILVSASEDDKVRLLLNGLTLNADSCAAIEVAQADKVFITTVEGSENVLTVTGAPDTYGDADAAVWADCTMTIGGSGSLQVSCPEGHGVKSTDSLKITGGTLSVEAGKRGLSGKDSVRIAGGDITVVSGTDGIRSTREDEGKEGYIYISGGTLQVTSQGDGFSAEGLIQVDGGTISVRAGERSEISASSGFGERRNWSDADSDDSSPSQKGLKADSILIRGGTLVLDTADDGLHTASCLYVSGGDITIASGDDALHSDNQVIISGGRLEITACYEGIEGSFILIEGGSIDLTSTDDGLNASGSTGSSAFGRGFSAQGDTGVSLNISGGEIVITAQGDGIDSNGSLTMSGGTVYICGTSRTAEVPIDYNGSGIITGGTLIAVGSTSHMLQSFDSASTQPVTVAMLETAHAGGEAVTLSDSAGNPLVTFTPAESYQLVIVSCPGLADGDSCTLTAGSEVRAMTIGSGSATAGGSFGRGGFGKGGSNRGGRGGYTVEELPSDVPEEDATSPEDGDTSL